MKLVSLLLCLLLYGCAATISPSNTPATRAAPVVVQPTASLLDAVITDWLLHSHDHPNKFVVLLAPNLLPGYQPNVEGWTILPVEETDPHAPPSHVRTATAEYHFNYHSSYVIRENLLKSVTAYRLKPGESLPPTPPPLPVLPIVEIDSPTVLCIDAILLDGTNADVTISQNRHHNMGGSGTIYHATRTRNGWICHPDQTWMN